MILQVNNIGLMV